MTTITFPDSLSRCDDAVITAKRLLLEINDNKAITADHLSWLKAAVGSLKLFDIEFTDEETAFFDECLAKLSDLVED